MRLQELNKTYYHGSMQKLPVGTILTPRDDYEDNWGRVPFYNALELYRPKGQLPHRSAVFMTSDEEDIDLAGGGTDWIFQVTPLGPVQKHDLNWSSEISALYDNGYSIESPEVIEAAGNYWNGVPHHNENVWEFLTPKARINHVEKY